MRKAETSYAPFASVMTWLEFPSRFHFSSTATSSAADVTFVLSARAGKTTPASAATTTISLFILTSVIFR